MSAVKEHDLVIPDPEIRQALDQADRGEVTIAAVGPEDWMETHKGGIMEFRLGNGWSLAVFNDCGQWDYLEWVLAPDGRREEYCKPVVGPPLLGRYRETFTRSTVLDEWTPSHPERWGKNCPGA